MRPLFIALLLALLTACSKTDPTPPASASPATTASAAAASAPAIRHLKQAELPAGVELRGKLVDALRWQDANGDNLLLLSEWSEEGKVTEEAPDGSRSAYLAAAHYQLGGSKPQRLWLLNDSVKDCGFDVAAAFDLSATRVVDADADGRTETLLGYSMTCTSDVSPYTYKLIVHAGKQKYALRGLDRYGVIFRDEENGDYVGPPLLKDCNAAAQTAARQQLKDSMWSEIDGPLPGCYESDADFAQAPAATKQYALQHWHSLMQKSDSRWRASLTPLGKR
ncbi:M949_RS01915 family surface polysaccharide biosynthesis protein [Chitinilyticum aquatile]|uniref:M949_RS01915 family surface polysaccharide biosynthesis protein n=1 Tax=Chitinilyticum aquatile TaxID=362520 RepID=UPI000421D991|nr:hypothetical protein [Chitinilyticum aquatile]